MTHDLHARAPYEPLFYLIKHQHTFTNICFNCVLQPFQAFSPLRVLLRWELGRMNDEDTLRIAEKVFEGLETTTTT